MTTAILQRVGAGTIYGASGNLPMAIAAGAGTTNDPVVEAAIDKVGVPGTPFVDSPFYEPNTPVPLAPTPMLTTRRSAWAFCNAITASAIA
jgi:hypothetical protein